MKVEKLSITIESIIDSGVGCRAGNTSGEVCLDYFPDNGKLDFKENNHLSGLIVSNKLQFEKIIRSALNGNLTVGQKISCVFIDGFNFLDEADYNSFIRMDRRNGGLDISCSTEGTEGICRIFTDGSFAADSGTAGYGGIIQDTEGGQEVFSKAFAGGASNLMELLAVLDGFKRLEHADRIQVNTDSRFVIRGMVQWMHFWKHNDWQTAYGRRVKYAEDWQRLYEASEDRFIEFNWIKAHSGHPEHEYCHRLSRESAGISDK